MAQANEYKRETAYKCLIRTVLRGTFIKKEGWESSYIMTEFGDFSRVNIQGIVISKEGNNLMIDDGTGQISGRMFENPETLENINVGDVVTTISRPREYNGSIYLTLEIVKKIDPKWMNYRKKELTLIKQIRTEDQLPKIEKKKTEAEIVESPKTIGSKEKIMKLIEELDRGDGASIEDIVKMTNISNAEELIEDMLLKGETYESRPGKIKLM